MKNMILITGLAVAFGFSTNAAAQSTAAQQGAPTVKTGAAMKAKAASPAPSDTAKNQSQKTTVGKGKATAKASAPRPTGRRKLICTMTALLRPPNFSMTLSAASSTPTARMISPARMANPKRPPSWRPLTQRVTKPANRWVQAITWLA